MRKSLPIIIVLTLLLSQVTHTVQACSPIFQTNYWYRLDSQIDTSALPPNVTATIEHPPYDVESHAAILGQIKLTNKNDTPLYIVPGMVRYNLEEHHTRIKEYPDLSSYSQDVVHLAEQIEQNNITDLSLYEETYQAYVLEAGETYDYLPYQYIMYTVNNPQSPSGANPPPPPTTYELGLILNNQAYLVPITVTYSSNTYYDANYIVYGAPMTDYLIVTQNVVMGQVIGVGADGRKNILSLGNEGSAIAQDRNGNAQIVGSVRVRVDQWLMGDGPDEIEIGHFSSSPGADCGQGIFMNQQAFFLLGNPTGGEDSIQYHLTSSSEGADTVLEITLENETMLLEALQDIKGISVEISQPSDSVSVETAVTTDDMPVETSPPTEPETNQVTTEAPVNTSRSPFILWGLVGLLLLGLAMIWYKKTQV